MGHFVEQTIYKDFKVSFFIITIFGVANLFSIYNQYLGTFLSIIEYAIVLLFIGQKKPLSAVISFLIFNTLSYEIDSFLYLGNAPFQRGSFTDVPVLGPFVHMFITFLLLFETINKYGNGFNKTDGSYFIKWILVLLVTGSIQGFICLVFNDNGILGSPSYPTITILETLHFASLVSFLWTCFILSQNDNYGSILINNCAILLLGLCLICVISAVLGYEAYSNEQENGNLLAPLASLFIPFMLTFMGKKNGSLGYVIAALLIIVLCFFKPNVMGSKWYLVIAASLFVLFMSVLKVKRVSTYFIFAIIALIVINKFSEVLISLLSNNSYNEWKAGQALGTIDFFQYSSPQQWFYNLAPSAAYRIDELLNAGIEFINKPFYAFFGKGFAGTTIHHTPFLYWEAGGGTFSDEQIKIGAYYAMHESLAVIFLRHGILGVVFFVDIMIRLIKQISKNNWALLGILWFLFFWRYGISFWIGGTALIMSFSLNMNTSKNGKEFL